MDSTAWFTAKLATPEDGWVRLPELTAMARQATDVLRAEGVNVRFVRSVFVPERESCFCIYEAGSADDVREAVRLAGLPVERIAEAITGAASPERPEPMSEGSQR